MDGEDGAAAQCEVAASQTITRRERRSGYASSREVPRAPMRVRIRHETHYRYPRPTALGPQVLRLRPAGHARAAVLAYNLAITPEAEVRWQHDPWGNRVARLTFPADALTREFSLRVECTVDVRPVILRLLRRRPLPAGALRLPRRARPGARPLPLPRGPLEAARAVAGGERPRGLRHRPHLVALNARVAREIRYILRAEAGIQSSDETLALGSGSCRDSARPLVDALRAQGFAARFVSGYLVQLADEGELPDQAKGCAPRRGRPARLGRGLRPGAGWIGLDGTSGLLCGEGHLPLACTVNPELAAPIDGTSSEPAEAFEVTMTVTRLGHEASPRRPYTDAQWAALRSAGDHIDRRLAEDGLALTMGGEPTWTSRENPHDPEWNLEALGPTKWAQALRLTRLAPRIARGGVVMHRMGNSTLGARACRGGWCSSRGATTAWRCGVTRGGSTSTTTPRERPSPGRRRGASPRRSPPASGSPTRGCPPTKTPGTSSPGSRNSLRTSIPSPPT